MPVTPVAGVATFSKILENSAGRLLTGVRALVTHRDGVAMADTSPAWFTATWTGSLVSPLLYRLTVEMEVTVSGAWGSGDEDAVYRIEVAGMRADCKEFEVVCAFDLYQTEACTPAEVEGDTPPVWEL